MSTDPLEWARMIFFHQPFPTYAVNEREALIGDTTTVDFRVSILLREEAIHMSTLVCIRKRRQHLYFGAIAPFHPMFVRFMLRRAVHKACRAGVRRYDPALVDLPDAQPLSAPACERNVERGGD